MNQLEVDYARAIGKIVDLEALNAELKERLASASVDVMLSQDRLGRIKELKVLNAELVEALDDIARLASNEGKSPAHEEALIILLTVGQRAIEAKARGES